MFIDFVINKPHTATLHPGTSDLPSNHITNQCDEANKNTVNSLKSGKMEQEESIWTKPPPSSSKLNTSHWPQDTRPNSLPGYTAQWLKGPKQLTAQYLPQSARHTRALPALAVIAALHHLQHGSPLKRR